MKEKEVSATRYQPYWEYALPIIRKAQNDLRLFKDRKAPDKGYVNTGFGRRGFSLCCVANNSTVRTEVIVVNVDAFDALKTHKRDIEAQLGVKLRWHRHPDKNTSTIVIQNPDLKLENREDWQKMAQFHAEWIHKFHDVIGLRIDSLKL